MYKKNKTLQSIVAIIVTLQFGILMPLSPVFAQAAQEQLIEPVQEVVEPIQEAIPILIEEPVIIPDNVEVQEEIVIENDNQTPDIVPEELDEEIVEESPIIKDETLEETPTLESKEPAEEETPDVVPQTEIIPPEETIVKNDITEVPVIAPEIVEEPVVEEVVEKKVKKISYTNLMRDLKDVRVNKMADKTAKVTSDFASFLNTEKERLDSLDISNKKKSKYLDRLEGQIKSLDKKELTGLNKSIDKVKTFFGLEPKKLIFDEETEEDSNDILIPENPASFGFNKEVPTVNKLENLEATMNQRLQQTVSAFISIEEASADIGDLPTIEDLGSDGSEIVLNSTITNLAGDLYNNPVEIYNFVRKNISYEPYYGAKKGTMGCLEEKLCNDVDSASLTISLLRAAGIPAHYKKSIVVISVDKLQDMLGIDKTIEGRRTVYGIFGYNDIPVYSITDNPTLGEHLDDADFTGENHFALEWVFPEIYYDYDERGGNIDNILDLSTASTTEDLQSLLVEEYKKQWIPLDVIFKNYTRTENEIVADTASFDTESFWYGFYQYQGNQSPLEKYVADLQSATGKDITTSTYHSYNEPSDEPFDILPPTLPYMLGSGVDADGYEILPEAWSILPDERKQEVKIQLLKSSNDQIVLEHTFFGSEINNVGLNLYYEGTTETDKTVIESYGGIHATPAELVDIRAFLMEDYARFDGIEDISIGESLTLRFEYYINGELEHDSEKFSTAGNQEGIYIVLSTVQEDIYLDTDSKILLEGNTGIAREYLLTIQEAGKLLEKSLDYNYNINFARAVVTQNRILNTVEGTPTTFDFKGLTIDAGTYINDWSNRGNYKDNRKDARLLWGLESSYQEGQIFENIAGIESISTVKGLQHAYANPGEYTVHIINSSNEGVIDSLVLSENTKTNMHTDVQEGNTILTPNKFVNAGNWSGIFYVSLDPEWTGTYAIGEQTQSNGGFTTDDFDVQIASNGISNITYYTISNTDSTSDFVAYQDWEEQQSILCKMSRANKEVVQGIINSDFSNQAARDFIGAPCLAKTPSAEGVGGQRLLTTNGIRYSSHNWRYVSEIVREMGDYVDEQKSLPFSDLNRIYNGKRFTFFYSTILGTFLQSMCEEKGERGNTYVGNCGDHATLYYVPSGTGGDVFRARAHILDKLADDSKFAIKKVGWPTSDEMWATDSDEVDGGRYQNFSNGQVYEYESWKLTWAQYTYGEITDTHNQAGGSGSYLGFPVKDPQTGLDGLIYQLFENDKEIEWNTTTGQTDIIDYRKYRCEVYGDVSEYDWEINYYETHGVLDTVLNTVDDIGSLAYGLLKSIWNITDTVEAITETIKNLSINKIINGIGNATNAVIEDLKEEYDASYGSSGCPARKAYVEGRIIGEVALLIVPATKLKALTKVKVLARIELAFPNLKLISKIGKFGRKFKLSKADDITEWNRIKTVSQAQKGPEGASFWKRFGGSDWDEEFPFDIDDINLGNRRVDLYDSKTGTAYEVKNYASKVKKSSGDIVGEIDKDVWLMNNRDNYRPVWVFVDKGPAGSLESLLKESGIDFITLTN